MPYIQAEYKIFRNSEKFFKSSYKGVPWIFTENFKLCFPDLLNLKLDPNNVSSPILNAQITKNGKLTPKYRYISGQV